MEDRPIPIRPPSRRDELIQERYIEEVARQGEHMDALARQLITLELAIPGLYATLLKLVAGGKATVPGDLQLYAAFGCWFLALLFSLLGLIPRKYRVDPRKLDEDTGCGAESLRILGFFRCSARYKRRLLIASGLLLFTGVFVAALDIA